MSENFYFNILNISHALQIFSNKHIKISNINISNFNKRVIIFFLRLIFIDSICSSQFRSQFDFALSNFYYFVFDLISLFMNVIVTSTQDIIFNKIFSYTNRFSNFFFANEIVSKKSRKRSTNHS